MKRVLAALILGIFTLSCTPENDPVEQSQMVVYLVDYSTNEFQAGTVLNFNKLDIEYQELDIDIEEDPIENEIDGAISLLYDPTGDKIFEGTLTTSGDARVNFPSFTLGSEFFEIDNKVSLSISVQDIGGPYNELVGPIWDAVDQLGLSEIFVDNDALIGRYLYKPNESVQSSWKWVILLFDQ